MSSIVLTSWVIPLVLACLIAGIVGRWIANSASLNMKNAAFSSLFIAGILTPLLYLIVYGMIYGNPFLALAALFMFTPHVLFGVFVTTIVASVAIASMSFSRARNGAKSCVQDEELNS